MVQKKNVTRLKTNKKVRLDIKPNSFLEVRKEELDKYMKSVLGSVSMPRSRRK